MTNALSIRNPESLKTNHKATLSVEVDSQGISPLFLIVPLGEAVGALMKPSEFKENLKLSVAKAEGAKAAPDAALGSPSRQVDQARPDRGVIALIRRRPSAQARFCVLLSGFTTNVATASVELHLEDKDQNSLAAATVPIITAQPRITSFVSKNKKYNALSGEKVDLSWEIIPPGGHSRLRQLPSNKNIAPKPGGLEAEVTAGAGEFTRYQLDAMLGEKATDSHVLTLFSYDRTQVKTYRGPGDHSGLGLTGAEILGIYNRRDRLYAVVRGADQQKGASIWWTDVGFDVESWRPLTVERNGKPTPIMIPTEAAARPGVIFDDKLYFMGGSSYDANSPGREVGYFHFEANTWVDGEAVQEEAWPKDMPARMGHAVVASPDNSRLWIIGGYNDGGALNDVWVYDKNAIKWRQHQASWEPRCLFGATFAGPGRRELWIAGGFDSPGGYPTYDDIWHCDTTAAKLVWRKLDSPLRRDPDNRIKQYCGCALGALGEQIYAFAAYRDVDRGLTNNVVRISFTNGEWITNKLHDSSSDWVTAALDCYRFDATVLGGAIFVRWLARSKEKDRNIHYLVCV